VTTLTDPDPAPYAKRDTQKPLTVLGIETSCDETGVAVVRLTPRSQEISGQAPARGEILAQALHSQIALHAAYGGVVPELASRDHVIRLAPLTKRVLAEARLTWSDIDLIAFTEGPGLAGALLVGASVAQGLSFACNKPVIGVHHLEGHLLSPLLEPDAEALVFPFLALLVSGGHTQLMQVEGLGRYTLLGETIDDAAGEAFDKSAQLLGLGYPGGPEIGKWALNGNPKRFDLPRPLAKRPTLDFSFAGLKTAVLTHVQKLKAAHGLDDQSRADMAASVQEAIVDVLMNKTERAIAETGIRQLVVAGGVGANLALRARLKQLEQTKECRVIFPATSLCTDNGVMIAWAGGLRALNREGLDAAGAFTVRPRWPLHQIDPA
jgi:N6-L-threonylcarbamoyladenine synthase